MTQQYKVKLKMKGTALFLITMVVGTLANPALQIFAGVKQERLVTGQIIKAIEDLSQSIKDADMDPWNVDMAMAYELPVPVLFAASAIVDGFVATGLSDIAVNRMNYSALTNRLTFDLSLPSIEITLRGSGYDVTLLGDNYVGSASGSIVISQLRIVGEIRISIGIISGISVRSISLNFTLGGIQSNVNVSLLGYDLSEYINSFLGVRIPRKITEYSTEINELLVLIAWQVVESAL